MMDVSILRLFIERQWPGV